MNLSALILMLSVQVLVASLASYFLIKVIRAKPKAEPDSYLDNDEMER